MTAEYLLDTNIVSDAMNDTMGIVSTRLRGAARGFHAINPIISGELWFGIARRPSARREERLLGLLARLEVLVIDARVGETYGQVRADLERNGLPIGQNDLWIAAHALTLGLTLITDNVGEFERVEGLRIENWLRP